MTTTTDWPLVLSNDDGIRPAGKPDHCFYCRQKVGQPHGPTCVVVTKLVRLRYTFAVDVRVPHFWTPADIESHRNDSSWCADNALDDVAAHTIDDPAGPCLCDRFDAEFVEVLDDTPHRETTETEGSDTWH